MEDVLLDAFGIVAGRDQWADSANNHVTFLNSSRLGVFDPVGLYFIDDGPPLAFDVNGPKRTDVLGGARTKVKFVTQFIQSVDGIVCVGQFIFVESQNALVVLIQSISDLLMGIFRVFQAPRLCSVFSAVRNLGLLVFWRSV